MPHTHFILDTDPGQDDAVAILFALGASDRLHLDALTAVAGNVPLPLTSKNARIICDWAGREDMPVYAGCEMPLLHTLVTAEEVHGRNGLDGVELHEPRTPLQSRHAVDAIIERVRAEPAGTVSLCAVGPLTNVAMAIRRAPDIVPLLKQIVVMGGCYFEAGNVTPAADFNFFVDPHAAAIVFESGAPVVVLPLDVTHKACTSEKRIAALRALPNHCGPLAADILTSYQRFDTQKFGLEGGPLHDPCAIGYLLDPTLFKGRQVHVAIETGSELTLGASVVDWWGITGKQPNAYWVNEVDDERFFAELTLALGRLP